EVGREAAFGGERFHLPEELEAGTDDLREPSENFAEVAAGLVMDLNRYGEEADIRRRRPLREGRDGFGRRLPIGDLARDDFEFRTRRGGHFFGDVLERGGQWMANAEASNDQVDRIRELVDELVEAA